MFAAGRRLPLARSIAAILALLACLPATAAAQQAGSNPPPAQQEQPQEQRPGRMMGIMSRRNVVSEKERLPLTPRQKFVLFVRNASDPVQFLTVGLTAGISQAADSNRGYGQGAEGYGKRYGAAFANAASSEFFGSFLFPVMLRQDPRYIRQGDGPLGSRLGHALTRVVVTRTDSGKRTFNLSYVLAALVSASISNAYYPQEERTAAKTFTRAGISMGTGAALAVGAEFLPDVARKLRRKHPPQGTGSKP
jgi:hypothetical protein